MELTSVTISGYRNIEHTTIELEKIMGVLSLNNYGKSNLLSAIVFGLSFMQQHPKIKQNMMNDVRCIPFLKHERNRVFAFEMKCKTHLFGRDFDIIYSYSFVWKTFDNLNNCILSECLKIKDDNSQAFSTYIKRERDNAKYVSSSTGRCSNVISIAGNDLVLNKLAAFDDLFYSVLIKQLLNINVYIDRHFDSLPSYGITFMSQQELIDLTLDPNSNIPKTLYGIKKNHPEKFQLLKNVFCSLFPSIIDIDSQELNINPQLVVKSNENIQSVYDRMYSLFVVDRHLNGDINFLAMSDGARRVLLLLTFIILAQINDYNLICIEEPENSIHPGLLRKFLYAISELAENTKILFSSHSPYLINYMKPENVYIGVPNDVGVADFKRLKTGVNAKKRLMKEIESSNMQLGDYLFDLMSGTEDDLEELITYVE